MTLSTDRSSSLYQARHLFLVALGLGTALMFIGGGNAWITVGGPLLTMVLYLVGAHFADPGSLGTSAISDSVYYLGFLFTLISLTLALLTFGEQDSTEIAIAGVVSRFGVALITTVVGLGVRMYLTNFETSVEEERDRSMNSLEEAGRAFRQQLYELQVDLETQRMALRETVDHATRAVGEMVGASQKALEQQAQAGTERLAAALTTNARTLIDAAAPVVEAYAELARRIEAQPNPLEVAIAGLDPAVAQASEAILTHTSQLAQATAQARSAAEGLAAFRSSLTGIQTDLGGVSAIARELGSAASLFRTLRETVAEITGTLGDSGASVSLRMSTLTEAIAAFQEATTTMTAGSHDVMKARQQLHETLKTASGVMDQMRSELVDAAGIIVKRLGPSGGDSDRGYP